MSSLLLSLSTILLIVLSAVAQPPDTLWTRRYGGPYGGVYSYEEGNWIEQTSDSCFIVAGLAGQTGTAGDIYLLKIDSNGDTLWTRLIGDSTRNCAYCVRQTTDNGYIIAGYTVFGDVYVVKTDANGDTLWTRTFGGMGDDKGRCVQQINDGGYIVAGHYEISGPGWYEFYLIRMDINGDTLWTRTYGGSDWEFGRFVQQTQDGGFIMVGTTDSYGAGARDVYLIRTDANGDTIWTRTYGGIRDDLGFCVQQTQDGGFVIIGSTLSYGAGEYDVYLIKTDANGDTILTRTYGRGDGDVGATIQETFDGGFFIFGSTLNNWGDFWFIKTDANFDTIWTKVVGTPYLDTGNSGLQTYDGGYIGAGTYADYAYDPGDVYLVRLASDGSPLSVTLTPHSIPIQIPPGGGSFVFDALVENNTVNPINFDAWEEVILPNGTIYDPFIIRSGLVSPAGSSIMRQITQFVPANIRAGNFTYIGNVGLYPVTVVASDSFPFEVLPGEASPNHNLGWAAYGWEGKEEPVFSTPPDEYISLSTHPNPFNAETDLTFALPEAGEVSLIVYNIQGREIARLVEGWHSAGQYEVTFNGIKLANGIYFAQLISVKSNQTQKLLLIK